MKKRPMLFSSAMAYPVAAGMKTNTRRIMNPQPTVEGDYFRWNGPLYGKDSDFGLPAANPYGRKGDQLWVREPLFWSAHEECWCYQADNSNVMLEHYAAPILLKPKAYIPSMHMPKEASRTLLEIVDLRVEQLHDISLKDAAREGMRFDYHSCRWWDYKNQHWGNCIYSEDPAEPPFTALDSFRTLWEHINGPCSWGQNPWVWVVGFKLIEGEDD
jgi:hypothetical protein